MFHISCDPQAVFSQRDTRRDTRRRLLGRQLRLGTATMRRQEATKKGKPCAQILKKIFLFLSWQS